MGIVGAVDGSSGNVGHFTSGEEALFGADPLLCATVKNVNDLLPVRVVMKRVAMTGGHVGADQEEFFSRDEVRAAEPFVVSPGVDFTGGVVDLDKAVGGRISHWITRAARRSVCNCEASTCGYPGSTLQMGVCNGVVFRR